jgi:hypothetical protein
MLHLIFIEKKFYLKVRIWNSDYLKPRHIKILSNSSLFTTLVNLVCVFKTDYCLAFFLLDTCTSYSIFLFSLKMCNFRDIYKELDKYKQEYLSTFKLILIFYFLFFILVVFLLFIFYYFLCFILCFFCFIFLYLFCYICILILNLFYIYFTFILHLF